MAKPIKSESPDEFLKRNRIKHYDAALVQEEPKPTININNIPNINQAAESSEPGKDCRNC